ncbi:MAG: FAD-binding protein [Acidimicrobiales bacterium]
MSEPVRDPVPTTGRPLRLAALVKQIPAFEEMTLGPDGRLVRDGLPLEMSAYCRRAVAEAVLLASRTGGTVTVITLGPPSAEDVLREAIAYGDGQGLDGVAVVGVHGCDPAFAGSDTLATARALAGVIGHLEAEAGAPFDLILAGRASVDADTGQVPPQLAELLDRAFATGVKRLDLVGDGGLDDHRLDVGLELDDEWVEATVALPAVVSAAERLIDPCKIKDPAVWAGVDAARIRCLTADEVGPGPWGQAASPTWVGETRVEHVERAGRVLTGSIDEQVAAAVDELRDRGVLVPGSLHGHQAAPVPGPGRSDGPVVAVVVEPDRPRATRELLSGAARLAADVDGRVVAVGPALADDATLTSWGADALVDLVPAPGATAADLVEEDVAAAVAEWAQALGDELWAVLVGGTPWGREVASRAAASLGAGLTGDAVGLAVDEGRLLAWKPAFGGTLVAAVRASSPVQLATVRAGVLPVLEPREVDPDRVVDRRTLAVEPRRRVVVRERRREDDGDALALAEMVVGVGQGVDPERYGELDGLLDVLGAELAATRKVTDKGWLPHARQLGITGKSISPRLYVALGTSGKYNHTVGVRSAGTVLAVNPDPEAPIFATSDLGIVGDWGEVVPVLTRALRDAMA